MVRSRIDRRNLLAAGAGGLAATALASPAAQARPDGAVRFDPAFVDAAAERMRQTFEAPGFAVAIVGASAEPWVRGYGVRVLGRPERVDEHTRFAIASNTKAYTAAAIAILVDEGKVAWDAPVTTYLPEFRMYDPAVTQMMTVRDLLCHRSGLPLGAGDLLWYPDSTHSAEDVVRALPYLKPSTPFRGGYAYDNILYIVAGVLIGRVSGKEWPDFIADRILKPVGEADAVPTLDRLKTDNVVGRHGRREGAMAGLGPLTIVTPQGEHGGAIVAAGGINASATDQARWMMTQLAKGRAPDGRLVWSETQAEEMWRPQVITRVTDGPTSDNPVRPVLQAYALGWFVQEYRGERLLNHSGGLNGQVTQTALLPRRRLGVAVFSNCEGVASEMLRNAVLDHLLGAPAADWAALGSSLSAKRQAETMAGADHAVAKAPAGGPSLPLGAYVGRYTDPWYGDILIQRTGDDLGVSFVPTPGFKSRLEPWGPDAFRTHFPADVGEDALVTFVVRDGRVTQILMKPFSPLADFSFDFQHLDFRPAAGR